ncbi:MAG: hypothetical protein RBU23_12425 [Candidatus Auribacterota bacterium]|jgi:hypothetical protein|nr:hypothetical protein [Candidatus Auribacterota bacterium]
MESTKLDLEKYSSAITLSDMEIFIFPELMYSLVLANCMSPVLWNWCEDKSFKKLSKKSTYRRIMRLKQYIMDEYEFNLDLNTWGLTHKDKELERFNSYISAERIGQCNALFGYEGDKYYYDMDIRRHFGLDKYDSDIIPYWKTETVEAMSAFRYKQGYSGGAGECVSLSALYAAAMFIVGGVPLEDMFMLLTPLHSQNFIDIQDGILTNNRRIVTKTMWYNGSEISMKAQRALKNEKVTIVAHISGHVHFLYDDATISPAQYTRIQNKLYQYLSAPTDIPIIASFLRYKMDYQKYFQICRDCHGQPQFVKAEVLFHYEHGSKFRVADETHEKLLDEVSNEDFYIYQLPGRIRCDKLEAFLRENSIDVRNEESRNLFVEFLSPYIPEAVDFVNELLDFAHTDPQLPSPDKTYVSTRQLEIPTDITREGLIEYLSGMREHNELANLAFYAYRDMAVCDWRPFVKAAVERNPVSIEIMAEKGLNEVYAWLGRLEDVSIYDAQRLAQPDEVANYSRGDGLEKAVLMANVYHNRFPDEKISIIADRSSAVVKTGAGEFRFASTKGLAQEITVPFI